MRRLLRATACTSLAVVGLVAAPLLSSGTARAASYPSVNVQPSPAPAFDGDAPDPNIVLDGSTYYAFTTGTGLGNHLQALIDTSGSPLGGWRSYTGLPFGSSALPVVPSWEQVNTQTSPGVFFWHGRWIMFYDAATAGHAGDVGFNCVSVATAASLSPTPVFVDHSTGPLVCQSGLGGAIDPSPFVDPQTGIPYLVWKSNDGGSLEPARIWAQQLSSNGTGLVGGPVQLMFQDTAAYPWETTIENPDMVEVGGTYFLLFSTGIWDTPSYSETFATCNGPLGPCAQPAAGPILQSYGDAAGPGGGSFFQTASGSWMLAYAAWQPGCTNYSCGGARRLFVAPATFSNSSLPAPVTGIASASQVAGYWLTDAQGGVSPHGSAVDYGSMYGQPLNAAVEHIVATPDGRGYWLVAADGGTFAFGDAGFYGSMGGQHLNAPVVDITPTRDGRGYWLVASDGGVFAFGDATFHGSMGGQHLNEPVVGASSDDASGGYWLVAADGGVFAFGAPFYGSTGSIVLDQPVNGMAPTAGDSGYWFVAADGGIFAFGDAPFRGSMGGIPLAAPVVGMAADTSSDGYWLAGSDGGVFAFGAPFYGAD
ncbi:MAG: family 43 glycosylhydrolase [Acidimicrobiales bacterium]